MNGFIVELMNRPGTVAHLAETIAGRGINITAFCGVGCGTTGTAVLVTDDDAGTRRALQEAGFNVRDVELVTADLEHKPGTLAAITGKLAAAGINVEAAMPVGMNGGKVSIAFATDDPARAREIVA